MHNKITKTERKSLACVSKQGKIVQRQNWLHCHFFLISVLIRVCPALHPLLQILPMTLLSLFCVQFGSCNTHFQCLSWHALSGCILAPKRASCLIQPSLYPCDCCQVAFSLIAAESQMNLIGVAAHHVVNACTSSGWLINMAVLPSATIFMSIIINMNNSSLFGHFFTPHSLRRRWVLNFL